jgi:putative ABC transport system permease protein
MLGKHPASTVVALLALALGIGANTAIFSVVNTVLLRPAPYKDPSRIAVVWEAIPQRKVKRFLVSGPNYHDWIARNRSMTLAAFEPKSSVLTGADLPERLETARASTNLFSLLGVQAALGRTFVSDDARGNAIVLSDALWKRKFGAEPNVLGSKLTIDGTSYEVVGVMPPGFRLLDTATEAWFSAELDRGGAVERGLHTLRVVGRLNDGVSIEQARADMQSVAAQLSEEHPDMNGGLTTETITLAEQMVGDVRATLLTLLGAVGVVLLIACANVANLLLARSGARYKEIAVRSSLGASPWNIAAQLLTESVVLALAGGLLGLAFAYAAIKALAVFGPPSLPRMQDVTIDWSVLAFTLGASVLTGILFGLAPALVALGQDLNTTLRQSGRGTVGGGGKYLRMALVVAEVALSVILLAGAGLLLRSFITLQNVNPGFRPESTLTFRVSLPKARYDKADVAKFYRRFLEKLQQLPGVEHAGFTRDVPLSGTNPSLNFEIENRPRVPTAQQPRARFRAPSAGYFQAIGLPLIKGRYFSDADNESAPPVAIVSETLAKNSFPNGEDPLGKKMRTGFEPPVWCTIVGVVGDTRYGGLDTENTPEMYFPYLQVPDEHAFFVMGSGTLVMRTRNADPNTLISAARAELRQLDPDLAIFQARSMVDLIATSVALPRFRTMLLLSFAIAAMVLAGIGLYGVIAYSVSQRTQEIGVRMAMGAQAGDVLRMVVGEGMRLAALGVAIGLAAAIGLAGVLRTFVFGVQVRDVWTFAAAPVFLLAVAFLASYLPARRATQVDALVALRGE